MRGAFAFCPEKHYSDTKNKQRQVSAVGATIKDVSKRTGLSQGTISKYLNNKPVKPHNREAIARAIEELGYQVNSFARGLRTASSRTVGILVPDLGNVFSSAIVDYVENTLTQHQYSSILCLHHSDLAEENRKLEFLLSRQVDGIILMPSEQAQLQGLELLANPQTGRNVPVIVFNAVVPGLCCDTVMVDNLSATRDAVQACFDSGHLNVGLMVAAANTHPTRQRIEGYRAAYAGRGLPLREEFVSVCDSAGKTASYENALAFLRCHREVTALIATGYRTVLGCKKAVDRVLAEDNRHLLMVGFDCADIADILSPKLSYVSFPAIEVAEKIVSLLLSRCEGNNYDIPVISSIPTQFISKF